MAVISRDSVGAYERIIDPPNGGPRPISTFGPKATASRVIVRGWRFVRVPALAGEQQPTADGLVIHHLDHIGLRIDLPACQLFFPRRLVFVHPRFQPSLERL